MTEFEKTINSGLIEFATLKVIYQTLKDDFESESKNLNEADKNTLQESLNAIKTKLDAREKLEKQQIVTQMTNIGYDVKEDEVQKLQETIKQEELNKIQKLKKSSVKKLRQKKRNKKILVCLITWRIN